MWGLPGETGQAPCTLVTDSLGCDTMRALWLTMILLAFGLDSAPAAEPVLEKTDLWEAGIGGYELYRIPCLIATSRGSLIACCEARKSAKGDWGQIDVVARRSTDGGKTWSPSRKIVELKGTFERNPAAVAQGLGKPGEVTINNPVLIADRLPGLVHLLYCIEYGRCFYSRSEDDGETFSTGVEITAAFDAFRPEYDWKVLATGPGHSIQLRSGRLVVPVWLSLGTGGHAHRPSVTATIFSDDSGKTWRPGEIAVPNTSEFINPNETTAVELEDGRVMVNVRTESKAHRRVIVTSPDGATGWSAPRFDAALVEPICMGSLVRWSWPEEGRGGRILFSNPDNLKRRDGKEKTGSGRDRVNLTVRLSRDEGQTWVGSQSLEPGFSGYSDLAVGPDGSAWCLYERGSTDGKNIYQAKYLTAARFNEDWLTAR